MVILRSARTASSLSSLYTAWSLRILALPKRCVGVLWPPTRASHGEDLLAGAGRCMPQLIGFPKFEFQGKLQGD